MPAPPLPPDPTPATLALGAAAALGIGLLPGLLVGAALQPRAEAQPLRERLLLAWLLGLALTIAAGGLLAALHALSAGPALALEGLACAVAGFAAHRRGARAGALCARAWRGLRSLPGAAGLVLVAGTAAAHALRIGLDPWSSPQTSWTYLGDALAMLDVHGIPAHTIDYGAPVVFETNKIGWYLALAQWIAIAGLRDAPWTVLHVASVATAAACALAVWVFARALAVRWWVAWLGAACVLWLPRVVGKLAGMRGETLGLALLFALLWLGTRVLWPPQPGRAARWRDAALGGIAGGVLVSVHGVPAATAALALAALVLVTVATRGRSALPAAARLASAGGVAALCTGALWLATGVPLLRAQPGLLPPPAAGEEYDDFRGLDPAAAFQQLTLRGELDGGVPPFVPRGARTFHVPPGELAGELLARSALPHPLWPQRAAGLAVLLTALVWAARGHPRPQARAWAAALPLLVLLLFAWGLAFSAAYHTRLPAEHPQRREFAYLQMLFAVLIPVGLEGAAAHAARHLRGGRGAGVALAGACLAFAAPLWVAGARELKAPRALWRVPATGRALLAWLGATTRPDTRLLLDGTTSGLVGVLAGRTAITEGRAPYFHPAGLRAATETLEGARAFFRAPEAHAEFLRAHDVDLIVTGSAELGARPFTPPGTRLGTDAHPQVARFGAARVYLVKRAERGAPRIPPPADADAPAQVNAPAQADAAAAGATPESRRRR